MAHRTTVSIIGTSGRYAGPGGKHVDKQIFGAMCAEAKRIIEKEWGLGWDRVLLVSGGAAVADHVAVSLFSDDPTARALLLYLPASWDHVKSTVHDTGRVDWRTNPGGTANYYHRLFSQRSGIESLKGMPDSISLAVPASLTNPP